MVGCGSLQMVLESIPDLYVRFVWPRKGVCFFDPTISWDTMRILCLHGRVFVTSYIGSGGKFLALYKYGLLVTCRRILKS